MSVQILSRTLSGCIFLDKPFNFFQTLAFLCGNDIDLKELGKGLSTEAHSWHSAWDEETFNEYIFIFEFGWTDLYFQMMKFYWTEKKKITNGVFKHLMLN